MIARLVIRGTAVGIGIISLMGLGALSTVMISQPIGVPLAEAEVADTAQELVRLDAQLQSTRKELERAHQILDYSARYNIPADLSAAIFDNAVAEGIAPAIGFRLVQIESNFQNSAFSPMAAIGLTQLRLPTARAYDTKLNASDLMNSQVNLRIGFRYLKDLLKQFDNDVALALEAYNKGPTLVAAQQLMGDQVRGRYSAAVLRKP